MSRAANSAYDGCEPSYSSNLVTTIPFAGKVSYRQCLNLFTATGTVTFYTRAILGFRVTVTVTVKGYWIRA